MYKAQYHSATDSIITDLFPKVRIQFVHGATMTVAPWEFEQGAGVSLHTHPHEQIIHCTSGRFEVTIEGEVVVLHPGDTVVVPGGAEHAAFARTLSRGVDAFQPVREDYRF